MTYSFGILFALECLGHFAGEIIFIFSNIFSKMGTYLHILVVVSFVSICLDKGNLKLIAFFSPCWSADIFAICADNHIRKLLFPSFLLALIMHSYLEIQYGGQQIYCTYFPATTARFVQKDSLKHNVSKLSLSQKSFIVFQKR